MEPFLGFDNKESRKENNLFEKISILPIAIFGALYFIFINMQESSINSDQLTRMNNRRKADEYLSEKLLSVSPELLRLPQ